MLPPLTSCRESGLFLGKGVLEGAQAVGDFPHKEARLQIAQEEGSEEDRGGDDGPEAVKEGSVAGAAFGVMTEDPGTGVLVK